MDVTDNDQPYHDKNSLRLKIQENSLAPRYLQLVISIQKTKGRSLRTSIGENANANVDYQ